MGNKLYKLKVLEKGLNELKSKAPKNENAIRIQLDKIGKGYFELKKYDEALKYYKECLEIEKRILPSIDTAFTLDNIALVYYCQWKYEEAATYYKQSIEIKEQNLPSNHFLILNTTIKLKVVLEKWKLEYELEYELEKKRLEKELEKRN